MHNLSDYRIFRENMATLKETSKDESDKEHIEYMTESGRKVVHFDGVKDEYVEDLGLGVVPNSNDALIDGRDKVVFVEFKNGYINFPEQFKIRKKIYDSVLIYSDIVSEGISKMRTYLEYILVYNEDVNKDNPELPEKKDKHVQRSASFDNFANTVSNLAKDEYVGFGIRMFENYCFKRVHTYTKREFEKYLKSLW